MVLIEPSNYQQKILNWLHEKTGNGICNAVAGAGKSTTLKMIAQELESMGVPVDDIKILVFGKQNANDLQFKFGHRWKNSIKTLHGEGYRMLQKKVGYFSPSERPNNNKYRTIAETLNLLGKRKNKEDGYLISQGVITEPASFVKLIDLVRLTKSPVTVESLKQLALNYHLDGLIKYGELVKAVELVLRMGEGEAIAHVVDYIDMLWLPVKWRLWESPWFTPCKHVLIDECQDLNAIQQELSVRLAGKNGRVLCVGDKRQAIMGFAGSDRDSYQKLKERINADELPLSLCYRCPKSHVQLVKRLFPEIPMLARENAPDGTAKNIDDRDLWNESKSTCLRVGDMVLARKTAPLVNLCLRLISKGITATVKGRDIGQQIVAELIAIAEIEDFTYDALPYYLSLYKTKRFVRFDKYDEDRAKQLKQILGDKLEAITAIWNARSELVTVNGLKQYISDLFNDGDSLITLSSCHRAKGLEADRVFLISPDNMLMRWRGQQDWQIEQEKNLLYVALTRSRSELYIVGQADWVERLSPLL